MWADNQTDMRKLVVSFCNFVNKPKKMHDILFALLKYFRD
jgi:hypothetical protein